MAEYAFKPIGHIRSCFREKFGIPRQAGLVPEAKASIELIPPFDQAEAFRRLDDFSHIWILFVFHKCLDRPWRATVRPPRLGGNQRVGVFASRSGFRPNPIGQSVVALDAVVTDGGKTRINVSGTDLLDGTPVLDIKPYLPYADSRSEAKGGYAPDPPQTNRPVFFSPEAQSVTQTLEKSEHPGITNLIKALLSQDPRPGYANAPSQRTHGMRLWDLNIKFHVEETGIVVDAIESAVES